MKNIHITPTEERTRLYISIAKNHQDLNLADRTTEYVNGQHLYITSDEEIKENDYVFITTSKVHFKMHKHGLPNNNPTCLKIILTTDPKLISYGVQKVGDEFLKWYVKTLASVEYVEVKKYAIDCSCENQSTFEKDANLIKKGDTCHERNHCGIKYRVNIPMTEEHSYLQGFIDQFGDGELGELDPNEWNALQFLEWLKLNNYEIIKKK